MYIAGGNRNVIERNHIYDNWRRGTMLISVPGPPGRSRNPTSYDNVQRANAMGLAPGGRRKPNGVDFWWDEHGRGNCWEANGSVTSDPASLDACPGGEGQGDARKAAVLSACGSWPDPQKSAGCNWFTTPPRPGSGGGAVQSVRLAPCPALGPFGCSQPPAPSGQAGPVNARQTCAEWVRAGSGSRRSVVRALRSSLAADAQFRGAPLVSEREALRQIELACGQPMAAGFSLFGLFTRAATYRVRGLPAGEG